MIQLTERLTKSIRIAMRIWNSKSDGDIFGEGSILLFYCPCFPEAGRLATADCPVLFTTLRFTGQPGAIIRGWGRPCFIIYATLCRVSQIFNRESLRNVLYFYNRSKFRCTLFCFHNINTLCLPTEI